jgi:hypothetical protein
LSPYAFQSLRGDVGLSPSRLIAGRRSPLVAHTGTLVSASLNRSLTASSSSEDNS